MTLPEAVHLADINVLFALVDENHHHHQVARKWFNTRSNDAPWASCLLTQAGFIRIMTNPSVGARPMNEAMKALMFLTGRSKHRFWLASDDFITLSAPFAHQLSGHKQITDACLLGIAVREGGVLVTMDQAIAHLAGPKYTKNLLVLGTG